MKLEREMSAEEAVAVEKGVSFPLTLAFHSLGQLVSAYRSLCLALLSELLNHEINNALTGLSGYAQMAICLKKEEVYAKAAGHFRDGTARLQQFVERVNMFAREDAHSLSPLALSQAMGLAHEILDHHLSKRNIRFSLECGACPSVVRGNMVQVAMMVLTYAVDARDRFLSRNQHGDLSASLSPADGHVVLSMSDTAQLPCALLPGPDSGATVGSAPSAREALAPLAILSMADAHSCLCEFLPGAGDSRLSLRFPVIRIS